ncbi:hypothetical protein ACFCYC_15275 [Streptomyces sp. NPDC056402]|uniref:hypothetical protein n=1 Tax=Streptomyces sp. NPDC056402 TaxID=3345810 RepID=UPI0035D5D017
MPLLPLAVDPSVVVIGVLMLVAGCGFAYSLGTQRRFLDVTPVELRGQAFGLLQTAVMTLQGLGPLALGSLTLLLPAGSAMAVAGGLTCLTALLFRLSASAAAWSRSPGVPSTAMQWGRCWSGTPAAESAALTFPGPVAPQPSAVG